MQNSTTREFHTSKRVKREVKLIEPLRVKKIEDTFKPRVALTKMQRQLLWCQYYSNNSITSKCVVDGIREVYLHNSGFEASHVLARAYGGSDQLWNLLPICAGCNNTMQTTHALEWIASGGHREVVLATTKTPHKPESVIGPNGLISRLIFNMFAMYGDDSFTKFMDEAQIPLLAIEKLAVDLEHESSFEFLSKSQIIQLHSRSGLS